MAATSLAERISEDFSVIVDEATAAARFVRAYGADDLKAMVNAPTEIATDLFDAAKNATLKIFDKDEHAPLTQDTFLGRT